MPDETELDEELEGMEQEAMDQRMLQPGHVPVADQVSALPPAAKGERKAQIVPITPKFCADIDLDI